MCARTNSGYLKFRVLNLNTANVCLKQELTSENRLA